MSIRREDLTPEWVQERFARIKDGGQFEPLTNEERELVIERLMQVMAMKALTRTPDEPSTHRTSDNTSYGKKGEAPKLKSESGEGGGGVDIVSPPQ